LIVLLDHFSKSRHEVLASGEPGVSARAVGRVDVGGAAVLTIGGATGHERRQHENRHPPRRPRPSLGLPRDQEAQTETCQAGGYRTNAVGGAKFWQVSQPWARGVYRFGWAKQIVACCLGANGAEPSRRWQGSW